MLTAIHVRNVRLFEGDWKFDLRPLTVICGTNSAGKSTLLKVPLLLQQSEFNPLNSSPDGVLRLRGSRLDLGEYRTFVTGQNEDLDVRLGVEIEDEMRAARLTFLRGGIRPRPAPSGRVKRAPYRLEAVLEFGISSTQHRFRGRMSNQRRRQAYLSGAEFKLKADHQELLRWSVERRGGKGTSDAVNLDIPADHFLYLPATYAKRVARPGVAVEKASGGRVRYGAHLVGIFPGLLVARARKAELEAGESSKAYVMPLPPDLAGPINDLTTHLDNLKYLAPLRAPAKRYYVAAGDDIPEFDPTGEYLPYVFRDKQRTRISYVPPGPDAAPRQASLVAACSQWLHYLGSGELQVAPSEPELAVTSVRDVLMEVRLRSPGGTRLHALVDSGFGYSQALPIIVSCLMAPAGSTILIEQPEVHLNPALQVRLAEFLVAVMRSGRQVIVETHSEHVVNTIRVLVAEDPRRELYRDVAITYLANIDGKVSKVDLSVQPDGTVRDWPVQFFGEAVDLAGRLLRAQGRHRSVD